MGHSFSHSLHPLTHNAHIVQVRLHAVVRAAAHSNFKLVGQLHIVVPHIEPLVDLLRQGIGIDQAILAGRALAGGHRPDLGSGAAGLQAGLFLQKLTQGLNVLKGNTLDFHGQPGGHGHLAAAEAAGRLRHSGALLGGNFAVAGDYTPVKLIRSTLVPQKSQSLHPGNFTLGHTGFILTH